MIFDEIKPPLPPTDRRVKLLAKIVNHQYAALAALFELITGQKPPKLKVIIALISGH
jgi:hypothetical protein